MFRSSTYALEKFIGDILANQLLPDMHGMRDPFAGQLKTAESLCSTLRESWIRQLLSAAREQPLRRYIQYQQAVVTQLSNDVFRTKTDLTLSGERNMAISSFYESVLTALEELLGFLRQRFYPYFDSDAFITTYRCQIEFETLDALQHELFSQPSATIDQGLLEAVGESVTAMLAEAHRAGSSNRHLETIKRLLQIVHHELRVMQMPSSESLSRALFKGNLNTLYFSAWYQDHWQHELSRLRDKQTKAEFMRNELKRLSVIFIDPDTSFESELPPVDQQLVPWLRSRAEDAGGVYESSMVKPDLNVRLPLELSVAQLAMFIRIFQKTGCFPIRNAARIMRFFTAHFTTKMQPNISVKSFNHAFYSMDQVTAAVVRDLLQKMINYVNKTYFPK